MAGDKRTFPETVRRAFITQAGVVEPNVEYPYRCAYCDFIGRVYIDLRPGQRAGWVCVVDLEWDHVHPEDLGGTSDIDNAALACLPCNRSKKNKTLSEWLCNR